LFDLGAPIDPRDQSTAYFIGEQSSSPFEFWNGYLAALLVYNSALSPSDLSADAAYLTERYETAAATPEPATVAMIFMGLAMVALSVRHPAQATVRIGAKAPMQEFANTGEYR